MSREQTMLGKCTVLAMADVKLVGSTGACWPAGHSLSVMQAAKHQHQAS